MVFLSACQTLMWLNTTLPPTQEHIAESDATVNAHTRRVAQVDSLLEQQGAQVHLDAEAKIAEIKAQAEGE